MDCTLQHRPARRGGREGGGTEVGEERGRGHQSWHVTIVPWRYLLPRSHLSPPGFEISVGPWWDRADSHHSPPPAADRSLESPSHISAWTQRKSPCVCSTFESSMAGWEASF